MHQSSYCAARIAAYVPIIAPATVVEEPPETGVPVKLRVPLKLPNAVVLAAEVCIRVKVREALVICSTVPFTMMYWLDGDSSVLKVNV
jgi:hypothetical protein